MRNEVMEEGFVKSSSFAMQKNMIKLKKIVTK